jgi:hypothetical protein
MVKWLIELQAPPARYWVIGQPPHVVRLDVMHLLLSFLLVTASVGCG